ncbi:hypothetical protein A4X06_0g6797 [Tilletia controversa]|uniref:RNA-directed DNA polymerase n=3 Tax=Tilletia TaxID=13289 RepID=A0A8X7MNC7_9BASI|nr:hypothetical protein A4X06_0g6797 [Tilletia controversa]
MPTSASNPITIPQVQPAQVAFPSATDEHLTVVAQEVRSLADVVSSRLDGINSRLGDMEHWRRDLSVVPDTTQNPPQPSRSEHQAQSSTPAQFNISSGRPAPFVTVNRPNRAPGYVPPHLVTAQRAAAALGSPVPAPTRSPPSDDAVSPQVRTFRSLAREEKIVFRRVLERMGTTIRDFLDTVDDQDLGITDQGSVDEQLLLHNPARTPLLESIKVAPDAASTGDNNVGQEHVVESAVPIKVTPATGSNTFPIGPGRPSLIASPALFSAPAAAQNPVVNSTEAMLPTASATTTDPPTGGPVRTMSCKQEFLGSFAGEPNRLEAFLSRVRDVIRSDPSPQWTAAVLRALPIALTSDAAVWHEGLSDAEAAGLTSFARWATVMRTSFPVNAAQQRREARNRKWVPATESAAAYYFHKLRELRQAFGSEQREDTLVTDIKDGLPTTMMAMLRIPRDEPTLENLRHELGEWEAGGVLARYVPSSAPFPDESSRRNAACFRKNVCDTLDHAPRVTPSAAGPQALSALAASYDPARVIPAGNGEPRRYRPPGKDTAMKLFQPCTKCGGDHFNFEHTHLVPQLRTMLADDDDYPEYPYEDGTAEDQVDGAGVQEEHQETSDFSLSTETGLAPSMFDSDTTKSQAFAFDAQSPSRSSGSELFLADRSVFSAPRRLQPNESAPALAQPKRAFGTVVALPKNSDTGTGKGYRNHVPLTTHIRVNDTDGRVLSSLLDTGASLSCTDHDLLRKMGGVPAGKPMNVHGIGATMTAGWVTLPVFLSALDPHGKHVHLAFDQDFHVLPHFPPGLCLGLDFIDAYGVHISPVRGRGRIGRYTFQVHERMAGPYASEAELCSASAIDLPAGMQSWIPVNATCLAPGVEYTVVPRLSVSPDETIRLTGPVGLLTHSPTRHILIGNYGSSSFHLEQGTAIADAVAATVGDSAADAGQVFTLQPSLVDSPVAPTPPAADDIDVALPFDVFDDLEPTEHSLTKDAATVTIDDAFKVGVDATGTAHPAVVDVLRRHRAAFALDGRPGRIDGHDMGITLLPDSVLQSEPPRRASPEKRAAMDTAIEQLLAWDVIEPSDSPVSFPVVMVRQNGKWRFCVDYRNLNARTVPDRYPLPTIDSIFQTLCGKKVFSSLDAIRGYHQLGVKSEDRWKTAFVCHRGLYQYKTVPFGLRNAPAVFQRMMDKVLGPLRWNQAVVYIDDSVIATDTMDEHVAALDTLLKSATATGLKFSPAKCTFGVPSLTLLGRKVSGAGVAIWADRAQAGWRYESADGHTRLVNIEAKPATASRVPIDWGDLQQRSFEDLRQAIAHPPVLAHPDPSRPYLLYTDASKGALAAILHQVSSEPAPVSTSGSAAHIHHLDVQHLPSDLARYRWTAWLAEDAHFGPILHQVRTSPSASDEWILRDGLLVRRLDDRVALPSSALPVVLRAVHDDRGHFGYMKTFLAVVRHFWRPRLPTAVRAWVKHCSVCHQTKTAPKTGSLDISKDPSLPFEAITLDLIYGFPRSQSGNDAALVIQDMFSRMVLLTPCHKEITAEGVAAIVSDRVLRYGWRPRRIVSDSEARVSGSVMSSLATSLGAVATPSTPYHQQANSVERAVQTLQHVLQTLATSSKARWDKRLLPSVELAMNASPSMTTGHRPFDLVFTSHPDVVHAVLTLTSIWALARLRNVWPRHAIVWTKLDSAWIRLRDRPVPGTMVDKLDSRKLGPFSVVEVLSPHRVRLDLPSDLDIDTVFNIEQLDFVPTTADPFAAVRLPSSPACLSPSDAVGPGAVPPIVLESAAIGDALPLASSATDGPPLSSLELELSSASEAEIELSPASAVRDGASAPPRARKPPSMMREFQLGLVRPSMSPGLRDALRGPLARPRLFSEDGQELLLTERPVAYLSRLTSPAESKLVAAELELVCFAWAFHKFAHLLEGAEVTIITDHSPMETMLRSNAATVYGPTITRCRALILPHLANLRFIYRPGPRHTNVDALSRLIPDQGRSASRGGKDEHGVSPGAALQERPGYPETHSGGAGSTE